METLGFKRSAASTHMIEIFIENEDPFFELVKTADHLYDIRNRITGKIITEKSHSYETTSLMLKNII